MSLGAMLCSANAQVPDNGLVARYLFNNSDINPNVIYQDEAPNGSGDWSFETLGTTPGGTATTNVLNTAGSAIEFNGSQFNIALSENLAPWNGDQYTYAMWLKPNIPFGGGTRTVLRIGESLELYLNMYINFQENVQGLKIGATQFQAIGNGNGYVTNEFDLWNTNSISSIINNPSDWFHVAVTFRGTPNQFGSFKVYINGVLMNEVVDSYVNLNYLETFGNNRTIMLGSKATPDDNNNPVYNPSVSYQGKVDELNIYYYALSDAEIEALYNAVYTPVFVSATYDGAVCDGVASKNISLTLANNDTYDFNWYKDGVSVSSYTSSGVSTIYTPTAAGTYYCVVSNENGSATTGNYVFVDVTPANAAVVNNNNTLSISPAPYENAQYTTTVAWFKDGVAIGNGLTIEAQGAGTYSATVSYVGNEQPDLCSGTVEPLILTSINENNIDAIVAMFPNPANDVLNLQTKLNGMVVLYDITGKQVLSANVTSGNNTISLNGLANGVYTLNMATINGNIARKIVKM